MPLPFTAAIALSIVCHAAPAWADFQTGRDALHRCDYATALREFSPQAEQGNADAQLELGRLYYNGHGVVEDQHEALKWYLRAAEQGHGQAQWMLGITYHGGLGVPRDYQQAANWYHRAAEQGYDRGQEFLAGLYLTGTGVPQDYALAHMWGNLAAARGNVIGAYIRDEAAKKDDPCPNCRGAKAGAGVEA